MKLANAAVAVAALVGQLSCGLADKKSVLFEGRAQPAGRSPSGEPMGFSASADVTILIDGKDESAQGDLRALASGTKVKLIVTPIGDGARDVRCRILLPGLQRTLTEARGVDRVVCEATIPR